MHIRRCGELVVQELIAIERISPIKSGKPTRFSCPGISRIICSRVKADRQSILHQNFNVCRALCDSRGEENIGLVKGVAIDPGNILQQNLGIDAISPLQTDLISESLIGKPFVALEDHISQVSFGQHELNNTVGDVLLRDVHCHDGAAVIAVIIDECAFDVYKGLFRKGFFIKSKKHALVELFFSSGDGDIFDAQPLAGAAIFLDLLGIGGEIKSF